jgi:CubicO group peptidase (beta-lactamase class C family)
VDTRIETLCKTAINDHTFPGCVAGYIRDGKTAILAAGHLTYEPDSPAVTRETVYDIASITKSVPTSCLILNLLERGLLSLDDKVVDYIPELKNRYRSKILVRHLLTYTVVFDIPGGMSTVAKENPDMILETLFSAPLTAAPGAAYYYTNSPAILMGLVAERITGMPLNELADSVFGSLPMPHTSFSTGWMEDLAVAPTELDWRGNVQRVVHDETAWALRAAGKLPGHAGLFSTAPDLLVFAKMLLGGGVYEGRRYFDPATVEMMHTNQVGNLGKMAGLGWEMREALLPEGLGSDQVFGKTGFTGCALVIDPKMELAFVYLSNRTYPKRPATREKIVAFRNKLAAIIYS